MGLFSRKKSASLDKLEEIKKIIETLRNNITIYSGVNRELIDRTLSEITNLETQISSRLEVLSQDLTRNLRYEKLARSASNPSDIRKLALSDDSNEKLLEGIKARLRGLFE